MSSLVNYAGTETERFWKRVLILENGCWEFLGGHSTNGYGSFSLACEAHGERCKMIPAHRWVYLHYIGPIPEGFEPDHLCRNRLCVNPLHLEAVPKAVNIYRGIAPPAINAQKLYCIRGHPLFGENVYYDRVGHRQCKTCETVRLIRQDFFRRAKLYARKDTQLAAYKGSNESS